MSEKKGKKKRVPRPFLILPSRRPWERGEDLTFLFPCRSKKRERSLPSSTFWKEKGERTSSIPLLPSRKEGKRKRGNGLSRLYPSPPKKKRGRERKKKKPPIFILSHRQRGRGKTLKFLPPKGKGGGGKSGLFTSPFGGRKKEFPFLLQGKKRARPFICRREEKKGKLGDNLEGHRRKRGKRRPSPGFFCSGGETESSAGSEGGGPRREEGRKTASLSAMPKRGGEKKPDAVACLKRHFRREREKKQPLLPNSFEDGKKRENEERAIVIDSNPPGARLI